MRKLQEISFSFCQAKKRKSKHSSLRALQFIQSPPATAMSLRLTANAGNLPSPTQARHASLRERLGWGAKKLRRQRRASKIQSSLGLSNNANRTIASLACAGEGRVSSAATSTSNRI